MAIKNHTNPLYYIATEALNITENIANDPRRILVTLKKGSIMKVYSATVSYFNTGIDGSYKTFPLNAYNTYLDGDCWYDENGNEDPRTIYMYARIDERDADADIIFTHIPPEIYALDGIHDAGGVLTDGNIHHILMGQMVYDSVTNTYLLTWDSGDLGTDHAIQTGSTDLFEVVTDSSTMTSYIQVLHDFLSITIKNTLTLAGRTITKFLHGGDGTEQDPSDSTDPSTYNDSDVMTSGWFKRVLDAILLRKDQDDSTPHTLTMGGAVVTGDASVGGDLTVSGNTSVGGDLDVAGDTALSGNTIFGSVHFTPDSMGYGYVENQGGHFLQVENLKVLGKMEAKEVEIQEVNYVGGSIVLTPANGFTIVRVVPVDENFDETDSNEDREGYKLYYNRKKDDGTIVRNTWKVGDLAYCERWDLREGVQTDFEKHRWWRKVLVVSTDYVSQNELDTDTELGWIVVSDVQRQMESLSNSVPMVDDKVVMLGHDEDDGNDDDDADRQTAIILSASQQYAPYIRMYKGVPVKSQTSPWYRLPEPFIDLNGYETNIEADSIKIHGSNNTLINVAQSLGKLDNKFEIWQADDDTTPTLNTEPASLWTVAEYAEHVGDFLILTDGRCFEFKVNSGVYSWEPVTDEYLIAYITELRSKATIFYGSDLPTNYKTNDIWMDATYPRSGTPIYEHEILIATKDSTNGQFNIEDWEPTNDYKQTLTSYMDAINLIVAKYGIQTDGRHETWYKNDYADIDGDKVDAETGNPTSLAQLWAYLDNVGSIDPSNPETETVRKSHLGDLAYITSSSLTHPDTLWEYTREVTTVNDAEVIVYGWSESYDEITKTILRESKDTQRAVDGKVTTYIYDSSNENMSHGIASDDYSLGDFWVGVNGTFQYRESNIDKYVEYHNETLVCICGYNDVGAGQNISDWKPIGSYLTNATVASVLIDQGFTKEDGVAKMYAEAVLNGIEANDVNYRGETLASASISALVEDDGNGGWKSAVNIDADRVNVTGQTTFLQNLIQGLDLGDLAFSGAKVLYEDLDNDVKNQITTLQRDLQLKATPEQIYTALTTGNTSIVGGVISTQLLDVDTIATLVVYTKNLIAADGTFTGRLEAQEGFFKGYLRTAFENADNVEIADRQNHYNLSCEHCNLIVSRNKEYVLPSGSQALQQVGKRMVFVDYVENTNEVQENAYPVQISLSNDAAIGFVGFLGNDVNTNSTNNPKSLLFKNGVLEFVCSETLVNGVRYAYWILISNQTAWCKRSDSIFRGVKMTPMLLWYGTVDISQMPDYNAEPSSSNTIFSASYIADGVGITGIKANRPTGACHIHVDISGASGTSWKKNLMVTVTGFGTYNNSPVMASVISNERPNSGNTANIGIRTYTYTANVESKFLMKIEFIG